MLVFGLQLLAEEKAISEKNAMERDNAERDARQNETKVGTEISAIWFLPTICKVGGNTATSAEVVCRSKVICSDVIFPAKTSANVLLGFQTRENRCKCEVSGRVFLHFVSVWKPNETQNMSLRNGLPENKATYLG